MSDHTREPAQSNEQTAELDDEQLDEISGGLNPQPLPPKVWAGVYLPDYYAFNFTNTKRQLIF